MPARSWDSYLETLYAVLQEIKPRFILEYGSGFSTQIMALYPSVEKLVSLEHDKEYYKKNLGKGGDTAELVYQPDLELYANFTPDGRPDLAFVDGRNRSACLRKVRQYGCPVILHDADREQYRESVMEYKFQIWRDGGNTVVLTDNEVTAQNLINALMSVK